MSMVGDASIPRSGSSPLAATSSTRPRVNRAKRALRHVFNTLGYALARKDQGRFDCPSLPLPSAEMVERAAGYFANTFPISPNCGLSEAEIGKRLKDYFWHYPFKFGDFSVEADELHFRGLQGRHYKRYFHIFPALLSLTGGSLSSQTVLEIGCNAGFWTLQARRAGAASVLGLDISAKNVEQASFIRDLIGMDGIEYRVTNAQELSRDAVGEFDVTFFLGVLYHLDKPIQALEHLYDVTKRWAVVDTTLARSDVPDGVPILKVEEDDVHEQNVSNRIALVPSKSAVPLLLKHVGFREVFWIQNASKDLPLDYLTGARMTFIAVK
jgi:2-polyprenyl-3-methyl-5-hydroxy-6-metoxy-1,4-benzoquinol methylase